MEKQKSGDVLQVLLLTLFMVSGFLLLANLYFSSEMAGARKKAGRAVANWKKLKKELRDEELHRQLRDFRSLQGREQGRSLDAEINKRAEREIGLRTSRPARRKPVGKRFVRYTKSMRAPAKDYGQTFDAWMSFLGRIERERPDIHVEEVTLSTKEFELKPEGRRWGADVRFVTWKQKEGTQ